MSTENVTPSQIPAREVTGSSIATDREITPELISHYVRLGHQLRAEAIARFARRLTARLRAHLGRAHREEKATAAETEDALSVLADGFRSPLTAIRSSAEILRDVQDLDSVRRGKFIAVVLAEEARLEALVSQMLDESNIKRGSRVWQIQLDKLKLVHEGANRCPTLAAHRPISP